MTAHDPSPPSLLYGQGTRRGMAWMFTLWTIAGMVIAVLMMPPSWHVMSRLVFGAVLGFFSAMFPYLNRVLLIDQ